MTAPPSTTIKERQLDLYEAIQSGRPDWKKQAYDEFYGLIRRLLFSSLGPHADIDDLIGDVFVGFFGSAERIRSADGLRSYLVSIAMNTVRRELRRRKRRRLSMAPSDDGEAIERIPSVDDPKAKAALLQLARILDQLGPEDHVVFVLHMVENLPVVDVAESLNMSVSTVKRRLKRANDRVLRRVAKNPLLADYVRDRAGDDDV